MLHITNGDIAADLIAASGVAGEVLPWRDVLHEGPVPPSLDLEALSRVRADYLSETDPALRDQARRQFEQRDSRLQRTRAKDHVVLWFEADLYDQLQLIQLLAWFRHHPPASLALICIGEHPDVPDFHGLGELTPVQMAGLYPVRQPVSAAELQLGYDAWEAFTGADPLALSRFTGAGNPLPFLGAALVRLLEEYPSIEDGLGRTEWQVLRAVDAGATTFADAFTATQRMETRVFMGDLVLWDRIRELASGSGAALRIPNLTEIPDSGEAWRSASLQLTRAGREYLAQSADLVTAHGVERWIGGVHLSGSRVPWRWDRRKRVLVSM